MKHKNILITLLYLFSFPIFSQNEIIKGDPYGDIQNNIFSCKEFNWQIKIPENYKPSNMKYIDEKHLQGIQQVKKENPDTKIDKTRNDLISFEYDANNRFTSSFNKLQDSTITLNEHKQKFDEILSKSMAGVKGARFEKEISNIKLGKYDFYKMKIEGYNLNNQLVISQIYYNAIINGNLFGVLISYTVTEQGKIMDDNFIHSFN